MKKITASTLFLTAIFVIAPFTQAWADPTPGWYVGLGGILNDTVDANASIKHGAKDTVDYDLGWGVEGSGGYSFQNGMRLEGEVAHIRAGVDTIKGGTGGSGTLADTDFFANAFYDFHTGTMWTPYIGGGAGMAVSDADSMGTLTNGSSMNDEQIVFAYQAIGGVSAQITPHWAITADYRYIATSNPRFATSNGGFTTIDNASHNIVISARYSFKPPEPTVIPEEVNAPVVPTVASSHPNVAPIPQSYMVFFDFDKSTLTPEAERIIASAAQEFKRGGYVKIVVTGHTDSVGTTSYNQRLSERRAAAVRAEFEKLGVPTAEVATQGVGKNGQLVPTADQVREAQNCRAEIVFNKQ